MSRAFVKEDDVGAAELPERPQSEHPNYITPAGYARLQADLQALLAAREPLAAAGDDIAARGRLQEVERDLRWIAGRLERAIVVEPRSHADIRFGARVRVADEAGGEHVYTIVGEDETCAPRGRISWVSPLARALLGRRAGDVVPWEAPGALRELEILDFDYGPDP